MAQTKTFTITTESAVETEKLAEKLGGQLAGGEVIELTGDIGAGKTTFVRGLARGIKSPDSVASPTFVLNRIYKGSGGVSLHHFDFYRLDDPGVMQAALRETLATPGAAVVIEWSDVVADVLPQARLRVSLVATGEETRELGFAASDRVHARLLGELS